MEHMSTDKLKNAITFGGLYEANRAHILLTLLLLLSIREKFELANVFRVQTLLHFFVIILCILQHHLYVCHIVDHVVCILLKLLDLMQNGVHILNVAPCSLNVCKLAAQTIHASIKLLSNYRRRASFQ